VPNLSEKLRGFLKAAGIRLNTDLGQHFLVDDETLEAIVEAGKIGKDDHVVEIGPGVGVLTAELLKKAGKVTAIELDDRFPPLMTAYCTTEAGKENVEKLEIVRGNALQVPLPTDRYSVIANIPYHITSPLLRHAYLESTMRPTAMTLLIQKEVAQKICDIEHAGLLTIMVGLFGKARIVKNVPPDCFLPPPEVDSAVLQIDSYDKPLADTATIEKVLKLLKLSFAGKRKMLRNTFGKAEGGMEMLQKAGIDPMRRPETLSVQEWITLAKI
jgi:16S rRNA (adenine1518-N6/adenine1519-N6)-dimethyltransferase